MESQSDAYAKVSAFVRGRLRFLSGPDAPTCFTSAPGSALTSRDELARLSNFPEPFVGFLLNMDAKLETILSFLRRDGLEGDFPFRFETLEVSGSGLLFTADAPLIPDSYVEIILFLGDYPVGVISGVGKIQPDSPQTGRPHDQIYDSAARPWRLQFSRIREADLDAIVQFVFQEERRKIREHRWGG